MFSVFHDLQKDKQHDATYHVKLVKKDERVPNAITRLLHEWL